MDKPASKLRTTLKTKLASFRAFVNKHRLMTIIVCGAILVAEFILMAYWASIVTTPPAATYPVIELKRPPEPIYSPLTGKQVASEDLANRPVTAVILENSPDARPQSGLKQAGIVYEAIAEGGITRFLALYQEDQPSLIGPVRSLRPYYIDWLAPFDASVAHVGGSAEALRIIRNGSYRDLDQMRYESTYWRTNDRYPPHNVYTDFKHINKLNASKGYKSSSFTPFERTDPEPVKKPNASQISVTISGPTFNSNYKYSAKNNNYLRSHSGVTHNDREKGAITPSSVVVITVPMASSFEDGPRMHYKTSGSGPAKVFQNGTVISGTWSKSSRSAQIEFLDSNKKPIKLVRGQTWITAVPTSGGGVTWK